MGSQRSSREGKFFCLVCWVTMIWGLVGCIYPASQLQGRQDLRDGESKINRGEYETLAQEMLKEANSKMGRDEYEASVEETLRVLKEYPAVQGDRALFQLGLLYAHPGNPNMDYDKSIAYFDRVLREFPLSEKREDARIWILTIRSREEELERLRKNIQMLEKAVEAKEKKVQNLGEGVKERDKKLKEIENELGQTKNLVNELEAQISKFKNVDLTIEKKKRLNSPPGVPSP